MLGCRLSRETLLHVSRVNDDLSSRYMSLLCHGDVHLLQPEDLKSCPPQNARVHCLPYFKSVINCIVLSVRVERWHLWMYLCISNQFIGCFFFIPWSRAGFQSSFAWQSVRVFQKCLDQNGVFICANIHLANSARSLCRDLHLENPLATESSCNHKPTSQFWNIPQSRHRGYQTQGEAVISSAHAFISRIPSITEQQQ